MPASLRAARCLTRDRVGNISPDWPTAAMIFHNSACTAVLVDTWYRRCVHKRVHPAHVCTTLPQHRNCRDRHAPILSLTHLHAHIHTHTHTHKQHTHTYTHIFSLKHTYNPYTIHHTYTHHATH